MEMDKKRAVIILVPIHPRVFPSVVFGFPSKKRPSSPLLYSLFALVGISIIIMTLLFLSRWIRTAGAMMPTTAITKGGRFASRAETICQRGRFRFTRSSSWLEGTAAGSPSVRDRPSWSEEWKSLGLGATLRDDPSFPPRLFFVQLGFGVDQHGREDATKAAIRAVRNAIEFNSIPGVISHIPGGRAKMLIHVKLGVPSLAAKTDIEEDLEKSLPVDVLQVAKVFPYGQLLPLEITRGGISFHTGRVVEELGDTNDVCVCVAACVSLGYDEPNEDGCENGGQTLHKTYNTKDGY